MALYRVLEVVQDSGGLLLNGIVKSSVPSFSKIYVRTCTNIR